MSRRATREGCLQWTRERRTGEFLLVVSKRKPLDLNYQLGFELVVIYPPSYRFSNSRSLQLIDTMIPEDWNIINAEISLASEISVNITAVQVSAYLNRLKSWTWFSAFNSWVYFTCLFVSLLRIRRFGACRADLLAPVLRVRLDTAGPGAAKGGKKFCITNICFEQKVFRLCCSWTRGRLSDTLKAL